MKRLFSALTFSLLILFSASGAVAATNPQTFTTQQEAQEHCPKNTVVWVNTSTGVYHFQGERWYGNTKHGAYVCQQEADQGGMRATRNGQ